MFNNLPLVMHLATSPSTSPPSPLRTMRKRHPTDPVLICRLRTKASIDFEADVLAPDTLYMQQTRSSVDSPSTEEKDPLEVSSQDGLKSVLQSPEEPRNPFSKIAQWAAARKVAQKMRIPPKWESHHVLSAIDRKDPEILMLIRDSAFELLLQDTGLHETPLGYAIRVQPEMAIVLLGAFSRYINNLQDEDLEKESTHITLRALRADLHSAIRHGLANKQRDLIASFLQTLVMSEGDKWVVDNVGVVRRALKAGPSGKPVFTARTVVRQFASGALKKDDSIPAVEDYIHNAAGDLLLMAAWSAACKSLKARRLPISFFARDDRVYRAFVDQLNAHMGQLEPAIPLKLRRQLDLLREGMQGRRLSNKQKLELLAKQMDEQNPTQPRTT